MEIGIQEVVKLLRVPEATVSRWVRQGYIPCSYRNGSYYFDPITLKSWAKSKQLHLGRQTYKLESQIHPSTDLLEALERGGVHYQVKGEEKQAIFEEVEHRFALPSQASLSLAVQLMQREKLATTGIGRGIAIPHPQFPKDWGLGGPAVGAFFLESPLAFGAADQMPVSVLFVLLSPTSHIHLQLLSTLAKILRNDAISAFILEQPTPEDLIARFKEILEKDN